MTERIAVYPGSFDPPTNGHLDLISRAARMFDRLIVAVAENDAKSAFFTVAERIDMLRAITRSIDRVEVTSFSGLTAEFARKMNAVALVRGLRVISDFEYELAMAIRNQKINPDVDTVCLMPSEPYLFISSRIVREIASHGGDIGEVAPEYVIKRLQERFAKEK